MAKGERDKIMQELKATEQSELLDFLISKNVRSSRSAVKSLLSHKQILVNGKLVTQFNHPLQVNDRVEVMRYDQTRKEKKLKGLKIVFEDDYIIVIEKEAGWLSVSTGKEFVRTVYNSLNEYVKKQKRDARVFVLHRLDREASGLMIFTKKMEIQTMYQRNWNILVHRYLFLGVIEGQLNPDKGTMRSWLTENKNFQVFASDFDNGGQPAVTHYETLRTNGKYSLVRFNQETRRKNQLRAQVQEAGCPIVGDKKYGAETSPIKRVALHAESIVLKHPVSGEMMEFKSPLSRPMVQLVNPNSAE